MWPGRQSSTEKPGRSPVRARVQQAPAVVAYVVARCQPLLLQELLDVLSDVGRGVGVRGVGLLDGLHGHLEVCLQLLGCMLEAPAVLLDGSHDNLTIAPQLLAGVLKRSAVVLHGSEHDLLVGREVILGVPQAVSSLRHGCYDDLLVAPQLIRGVEQRIATVRHGGQDDVLVAFQTLGRVQHREAVLLRCLDDDILVVGVHLDHQHPLTGRVPLREGRHARLVGGCQLSGES
mmetsp:Transcript_63195/g.142779  ORF Transcript_63195/g.142779 Transcript_63195/m.142779 type:complete len:232 (+) Transcript_63195:99-794(+)